MTSKHSASALVGMGLWLVAAALPALGQSAPGEADDYRAGDYGRVSDARDGLQVLRSSWQEQANVTDEAGINSPIFPGDEVLTAVNQRVEVQLAGGSLVWIDERSALEFAALPDPYSDVPDNAILKLSSGSLRMSALVGADAEFRIDTPAASIYPLDNADFRVDVGPSGRTTISSHRGVIEVAANGGSVLVRAGKRSIVSPGALPLAPESFHSFASDALDRYANDRDDLYRGSGNMAGGTEAYRDLPDEIRPYYRELAANGNWSYFDDYGYVWTPTGVARDWRPYTAGYWGYGPHGYFWISNEPWGWAPYHYGRWSYISGHGWGWTPGALFGGAWVSWSWGSAYVGWGPLDYWNYPAYRSVSYHGYYDPFCWTFISYNHFYHTNYHHYYSSWDHVSHSVGRSAVVTRPPSVSPRRLASSTSARESAVDQLRTSRGRVARNDRSRRSGDGFRSRERQTPRVDRGTERSANAAPAGRTRSESNLRSDERRSIRGGRERLAVSSTRRTAETATADRGRRSPSALRSADSSSGSSAKSRVSRKPTASSRSRVDGRMRDLFRRVSRPRQTTETPSDKSSRATTPRKRTAAPKASGAPTSARKSSGGGRGAKSKPPSQSRGSSRSTGGKKSVSRSGSHGRSGGKSGGGRSGGSRSRGGRRR